MKENFYEHPLRKTSRKDRSWRFLTRPISLLAIVVMLLFTTGAYAQFADYYDPINWALTETPEGTGGSVDTGAAPASISITSGNNGNGGITAYTITIPSSGFVSFDWSYSTIDGAEYDYPQYAIDGDAVIMPGYDVDGDIVQGGTASIPVNAGQTFSLIMYTDDGAFGAAVTTFGNFLAPPDLVCEGVSPLGNTLSSVSSICSDLNFTLSLQNIPSGSGIVYQWQTSPDDNEWTDAGPNSAQWTTSQTESTYYRCTATCIEASVSETSTSVLVEVQTCIYQPSVEEPSSSTLCNASYYDAGGPSGQYANSQNSTFTIYPEPGNLVQVTFDSFDVEPNYDYVIIYDGDNTGAPTINSAYVNPGFGTAPAGAWTGTNAIGQTFTGTSGPLTFSFFSDITVFANGWSAVVSCITAPDCMPPTNLMAEVTSVSSAAITWNASDPTPLSYDVYYNNTGDAPDDFTSPSFTDVTETTQNLSDLEPMTTYYVWVRANCSTDNSLWIGPVSFYLGYCIPTTSFTGDHISNFSTLGAIVNVDYTASDAVPYTDNSSMIIQHYANGTFDFSTTYVGGTNGVNIWVDWNNDFVFDESEIVFSQMDNGATTTGSITIPDGTVLGDYRLRIRSQWIATSIPPCGNVAWGETEDYTLTVIEAPSCIPPTGLSASLAQNESSTLNWTASVSEPANGYSWFLVDAGAGIDGTQIASGTTDAGVTTATASGLTDFVSYDLYVSAICADGDESAWAGPVSSPAPCTNSTGLFPSATHIPVCNGIAHLVAGCAFPGEHAMVQVEEGVEYVFSVSVDSDIITIASEDNSIIYTSGIGSITWTSTVTGNVRFYSHLADCGTAFSCRDKFILCGEPWLDEASVQILYTLGSLPLVYGDNHQVQAWISNTGTNDWTKDITLTIEGANTFTDVFSLELAVGQDSLITFAPFAATSTGMQTVTVSVVDDNENDDNSYSVEQLVTDDLFGHKEPGAPVVDGGVGIGGGFTGNFVAKFTTSTPGDINEIKVDFESSGVAYQYRIFAADGPDGLPGTVLYESAEMTTALGQAFLPVSPAVTVNGDFYVGLRELGTNFQFAYQVENPLRTGIFYFNTEDGTFPWTDISASGVPTARLAIEAQMFTETAPNCAINTAPSNNAIVCHTGEVTLSWASGGGAPTGYHLYFGTSEEPEFVADVTETSYIAGMLEENSTYYWYVIPFNEFGEAEGCTEVHTFSVGIGGCYCIPEYDFGTSDGDLISNVEILGTTLANNTGTTPGTPSYTYFTGQPNYTAELQAGTSYTVSVTVGTFGTQNVSVWIDYNDNGIFEEEERVGNTDVSIGANGSATFSINLDCNAPLGVHRMRVRDVYNVPGNEIDPCAVYGFGETEDYDVTITTPPACPTPYGGFAEYVTDVSAVLFWQQGCEETEWNVHVAEAGSGAPTGDPSHLGVVSPLSVDGLTPFTFYEFWVMAVCDDENNSDWAGPYVFSTLAIPPPVNDNPCGAIAIETSEDCNYVVFSNENATNTPFVDDPSCSFYDGSDVWLSVVVPGNGIVTIDTQQESMEDISMAVYTADSCNGVLTEIGCNDDDSPSGGALMPYLELNGLDPGEILYIRVFSFGNAEIGTFGICATSPCTAPINIEIEVVGNSATISWPTMGENATYNWEVRLTGEPGSGEDGLVTSGQAEAGVTSITIDDLEYLTIYNFYLSTNCSEETTSEWSAAQEFVTSGLPGCTNPLACNYNPEAGVDDGSCILELSTWYADTDGDGFGDSELSEEACEAPEGFVSDNTDCDDSDETVWQSDLLYIDNDGDGYDNGTSTICYGQDLPDGYSLTSDGTDCNDEDATSWTAEVLEVSLNLPIQTICNTSAAFTLTGGSPAGGTWSGTGVTGGSFNPATAGAGAHTITYTVAGDGVCTIGGSASAAITVNICPGIEESSIDEIFLYPTQTRGIINIVGSNLKEVIVHDLNGKNINTMSLNNTSIISIENYSAGIYFLRVVAENKVRTFKVVKVD